MGYTGEAKRMYQRQWVAQRRAEWFEDKSCAQCGSTECLELDHIERKTKVSNAIWSWSKVRREAELAKCQVLCVSCHRQKTTEELRQKRHGTSTMYRNGCRCDPCKERQKKRMRTWREEIG